jgi:hypothetical protein
MSTASNPTNYTKILVIGRESSPELQVRKMIKSKIFKIWYAVSKIGSIGAQAECVGDLQQTWRIQVLGWED